MNKINDSKRSIISLCVSVRGFSIFQLNSSCDSGVSYTPKNIFLFCLLRYRFSLYSRSMYSNNTVAIDDEIEIIFHLAFVTVVSISFGCALFAELDAIKGRIVV